MKTFVLENGCIAKLGENARENWELISSKEVKPGYYWFHLYSFPSGHLVLFSEEIKPEIIEYCCDICKTHSKMRNIKNIKIDCTQVKNLIKTEKIGEVEYKSNRKVTKIKK